MNRADIPWPVAIPAETAYVTGTVLTVDGVRFLTERLRGHTFMRDAYMVSRVSLERVLFCDRTASGKMRPEPVRWVLHRASDGKVLKTFRTAKAACKRWDEIDRHRTYGYGDLVEQEGV